VRDLETSRIGAPYIYDISSLRVNVPNLKGQKKATSIVELHSSRLIETANHPGMQKIQITEFFFENRLHWQFEVEKCFYKRLF
jgi:hypothetical protein